MPGTRVVLHVGAHKTGTSLVQKYLRENVRLLRRHRVEHLGRLALDDLVGWGPTLLEQPQLLADRLAHAARNPWFRHIVGSHENTIGRPFACRSSLYADAPGNLDALAEVLRPYRARVVLSVRPQHEFLESYYLQTVQQGRHHRFGDWLDGLDLDSISWRPLVAALEAAFGPEQVEILDFRLIRAGQDAYLARFFEAAGLTLDVPIAAAATRNPSISAKGLDLALAANPYLRTGPERKAMRVFLQSHFSNLDYPRPQLLSAEQTDRLRERYDGEYEQLVSARDGRAAGPDRAAGAAGAAGAVR